LINTQLFRTVAEWLAITSLATFLLSLLIIPLIIGNLPAHCFLEITSSPRKKTLTALRVIFLLLRNIIGILLLFAGIVMLFLPGQGLLTMLIGILLLSFPGKRKILTYLIHKQSIQRSLDWIRKKSGSLPFIWPDKN